MTNHPALARLLERVAQAGGRLEYIEGKSPFSDDVLEDAQRRGLLHIGVDGGQGAMEVLTLTDQGREAAGMPPLFSLARWVKETLTRVR